MTELYNNYIKIIDHNKCFYGGNQAASDKSIIKKCGCGIVAAADLILYLKGNGEDISPISLLQYNKFLKYLNHHYFPLIPELGMNSLVLTAGINLYFRKKEMPYKAIWLASASKLFYRIEQQLSDNIPVIMSVGPNFPFIWQKYKLKLYSKRGNEYYNSSSVKAHYFTATGIDENYIKISSWGREFYINKKEFKEYVSAHSSSFLCNMLQIKTR